MINKKMKFTRNAWRGRGGRSPSSCKVGMWPTAAGRSGLKAAADRGRRWQPQLGEVFRRSPAVAAAP
jgi:hypothetical protein